jgi:uncharacterized protein (TIGR00725 family)
MLRIRMRDILHLEVHSNPDQWIAVLGSATKYTEEQVIASYKVGSAIAKRGKNVITGATTGLPYAASIAAHKGGASVTGISPAKDHEQHVQEYCKPTDSIDFIVYSGLSIEGRGPLIIRSAAACIIVGGEFGTLNEFTAAWLIGGKIIGILTEHGGVADTISALLSKNISNYGNQVVFNSDPQELVDQVCDAVEDSQKTDSNNESGADIREIIKRRISSIGRE